ncbi:unnamed protein product, partial [marine sediment metagenome]
MEPHWGEVKVDGFSLFCLKSSKSIRKMMVLWGPLPNALKHSIASSLQSCGMHASLRIDIMP